MVPINRSPLVNLKVTIYLILRSSSSQLYGFSRYISETSLIHKSVPFFEIFTTSTIISRVSGRDHVQQEYLNRSILQKRSLTTIRVVLLVYKISLTHRTDFKSSVSFCPTRTEYEKHSFGSLFIQEGSIDTVLTHSFSYPHM
jgi:hypothetical protein